MLKLLMVMCLGKHRVSCVMLDTLCKCCREQREQTSPNKCGVLRECWPWEGAKMIFSVCTAETATRLYKCCAYGNHTRNKQQESVDMTMRLSEMKGSSCFGEEERCL